MQGGKAVCSKLFNNSKPLRKKSEGFAGKVRRDKKSVVFVENGSAMRAAVASMAISDRQYGHFLVVFAMRPISGEIMSSVRDETMFGEYCQLYVYMCAKSEKIGCPHRASVRSH